MTFGSRILVHDPDDQADPLRRGEKDQGHTARGVPDRRAAQGLKGSRWQPG